MKKIHFLLAALLGILMLLPAEGEAQASRTVTVVKVNRQHPVKRTVRRKKRKVRRRAFRTLRQLPAGTRAIRYRSVAYYPVGGKYYVASKGVYVRTFPPRGFRVRTLAVAPVRVVVARKPFWYAQGVFYTREGSEYEVVDAPVGAIVPELPDEAEPLDWDGVSAYELNAAVYREVDNGFEVIDLLDED
ncbi:DUF6515 family protein [Robiginitalea sp. M366]|uniref:DUF6515 family protein n=1 Tax=Robiginitalea aestuariiviva TaxID=3036903 RepID=UPI00240D94E5|nr:DUF6515 family protein [Robiginitalea aestuariiviva]MDG1572558.1 DUF6515 family protein [Robiginitalea aestuariiviva]